MKKIKLALVFLGSILALSGCASNGGVTNEKQVTKVDYKIVDSKGAAFQKAAYPQWVPDTEPGLLYTRKEIKKKFFDGDEFWAITLNGVNLEILKEYANGIEIQVEVAKQFSSGAKTAAKTVLATEGKSDSEAEATGEFIKEAFSNATFSGLAKDRDWWIKKEFKDGREEYEYRVIYTLDKVAFKKQQDAYLDKLLTQLPKDSKIDPKAIGLAIDYIRQNGALESAPPTISRNELLAAPGMEGLELPKPEISLLPNAVQKVIKKIESLGQNSALSPEHAQLNQQAAEWIEKLKTALANGTALDGQIGSSANLPELISQLVRKLKDIGWYEMALDY